MTIIICDNGVELLIDETIKVGDIITAYNKGFHRVEEIKPRKGSAPLVQYSLFAKADGKTHTGKCIAKACDMSYCRHAREFVAKAITKAEAELISLKAFQLVCK